jgi:hypothetical protein
VNRPYDALALTFLISAMSVGMVDSQVATKP